jgi:formylmethanofuran dehydrogenase subunit B
VSMMYMFCSKCNANLGDRSLFSDNVKIDKVNACKLG